MCRIKGVNTSGVPVGTIQDFGQSALPSTFLPCDGTTRLIADYQDLYNKITTTYNTGGEGVGEFRLPDATGRTRIRAGTYTDPVSGSINRTAGQAIGAEKHQLTQNQLAQHKHDQYTGGGVATGYQVTSVNNGNPFVSGYMDTTATQSGYKVLTENSGNNESHNNMQPTLVVGNVGIAYV